MREVAYNSCPNILELQEIFEDNEFRKTIGRGDFQTCGSDCRFIIFDNRARRKSPNSGRNEEPKLTN